MYTYTSSIGFRGPPLIRITNNADLQLPLDCKPRNTLFKPSCNPGLTEQTQQCRISFTVTYCKSYYILTLKITLNCCYIGTPENYYPHQSQLQNRVIQCGCNLRVITIPQKRTRTSRTSAFALYAQYTLSSNCVAGRIQSKSRQV